MFRPTFGFTMAFATAMLLMDGAAVEAQGRGRRGFHIPPGHMPAPGMCRVWYQGVPPGHQPRAVPCRALRGRRFANAVVIGTPLYHRGHVYWDVARDPFADFWVADRRGDTEFRLGLRLGDGARIFASWESDGGFDDRRFDDGRFDDGRHREDRSGRRR